LITDSTANNLKKISGRWLKVRETFRKRRLYGFAALPMYRKVESTQGSDSFTQELIMEKAEEDLSADHHETQAREREAKVKAFFEMIAREYSEGRGYF
jgi:hypothetical protein